jgi:hypothetical protein
MRNGRKAVSRDCERVLGVRGFIERSMPPRLIEDEPHIAALVDLLHGGKNGSGPKLEDSI